MNKNNISNTEKKLLPVENNIKNSEKDSAASEKEITNFIHDKIDRDLAAGKNSGRVHTRFPPEPNGYLHIGHAKAIVLNYTTAQKYRGKFNLRFDDTNPVKEDTEYVESIKKDIHWLGAEWEDRLFFASSYFEKMYEYAVELINKGLAFVDDLSADQIREYRGTLKEGGKNSPYRDRTIEENLDLFKRMRAGDFKNGEKVLRAKINMASPNMNMRDPVIFRILHEEHHSTGNKWCIYPMYDFAHPLEDAIEKITHSLCTLEFEDHRPFYNWALENLDDYKVERPEQTEFARLNLTRTIMSKRYLKQLVDDKVVMGWDDPRMPTIAGLRRRGYTPESIRDFCERIGVAKRNSTVDVALLEFCLREDLNKKASRVMGVLDPLKMVITNFPEDHIEYVDCQNNPEDESAGLRKVPFTRELYIEQDDFMEVPMKKFHRLSPGKEIRLKHAYYITCTDFVKDENGKIIQVNCTYDPASKGGWTDDGRKVRGTSHWVSATQGIEVEVRIPDYLLKDEDECDPEAGFMDNINPDSMKIITKAIVEPSLKNVEPGESYQFLRMGYFCVDPDTTSEKAVFNRAVSLKDSWAKLKKKSQQSGKNAGKKADNNGEGKRRKKKKRDNNNSENNNNKEQNNSKKE